MADEDKKRVGQVGANLVVGDDRTLYDRFMEEVNSDPELDQSKVIRIALKEYFARKDKEE